MAEDNHGSETLLAIVGAAPAKVVISNSVSVVEEKAPFKPPFVAHAWHWYAPFCRFRWCGGIGGNSVSSRYHFRGFFALYALF